MLTILYTLLKILKGASNDFSADNSAMHPHFTAYLFSLHKDMEFQLQEGEPMSRPRAKNG